MMAASLPLSALGLLALPGLLRPLARHLPPAEWAKLCAVLLATGAIAVEVVVVLVATPTVMRAVGLGEIADLCQQALGRLIPGGAPVGWAALVVAAAVPVLAGRDILRSRRDRHAVRGGLGLGKRLAHHGHAVVVRAAQRPHGRLQRARAGPSGGLPPPGW